MDFDRTLRNESLEILSSMERSRLSIMKEVVGIVFKSFVIGVRQSYRLDLTFAVLGLNILYILIQLIFLKYHDNILNMSLMINSLAPHMNVA